MNPSLHGLVLAAILGLAGAVPGNLRSPAPLGFTDKLQGPRNVGPRGVEATFVKATLVNGDDVSASFYSINVKVGTPPQEVGLLLNSRSDITWVPSLEFNARKSITFSNRSLGSVDVVYGDPTVTPPSLMKFHLDLHEDVMTIGGISIPKQRFGIAKPHEGDIGAFSIGPDRDLGYEAGKPFNSVLDNLAAQKAIASRTYSLDLRDFDDPKAGLLFGGANTGRFEGKLVKRPLVKDELGTWEPSLVLTGLGQSTSNGAQEVYSVDPNHSTLTLDTSNQYLRLTHAFADPLLRDMGAVNNGKDAYTAPCSLRDGPGSWDFKFGEATIKIPYKDIIQDAVLEKGTPFFQSAYISYDFDNQQVALAQAADCEGKVVTFGSGPNAIPDLTGCKPAVRADPSSSKTGHTTRPSNSTTSATGTERMTGHPTLTSTMYETRVATISACPTTVHDCPLGGVTTEIITRTTTWCPGSDTVITLDYLAGAKHFVVKPTPTPGLVCDDEDEDQHDGGASHKSGGEGNNKSGGEGNNKSKDTPGNNGNNGNNNQKPPPSGVDKGTPVQNGGKTGTKYPPDSVVTAAGVTLYSVAFYNVAFATFLAVLFL
ncbi:secreted aspartic proteinase [Verticillium dahliae VdLs.17]|uniref:Secreted aspartic proteinase n=1 Tax=Verticillium dahliae (strain VdLs.17 / ATCC MYA-4575 / FGSC 10137) TaxID=498257 RepID=G2X497_VERDV|nr:secreted aspartic proteinase [Verticillium dahliae VdLs.17]EGY23541.1 secreted aspartic proteinase [Verticillium dahliae VdLs.17]